MATLTVEGVPPGLLIRLGNAAVVKTIAYYDYEGYDLDYHLELIGAGG